MTPFPKTAHLGKILQIFKKSCFNTQKCNGIYTRFSRSRPTENFCYEGAVCLPEHPNFDAISLGLDRANTARFVNDIC